MIEKYEISNKLIKLKLLSFKIDQINMFIKRGYLYLGLFLIFLLFQTALNSLIGSQPDNIKSDSPSSDSPFKFVDLMPTFWSFWEKAEGLDSEAKIRLFRETLINPNKKLYYHKMIGEHTDEKLGKYLDITQPLLPEMRRISNELTHQKLNQLLEKFLVKFPDFERDNTIYLMPSLYYFEGQGRPRSGKLILLFGLDAIAKTYGNVPSAFIHHEIFHVYHYQIAPEHRKATDKLNLEGIFPKLHYLIWIEGLAGYISHILNPDASESELLALAHVEAEKVRPIKSILAKAVRKNLNSNSDENINKFFFNPIAEFPTNSGYYIGMLVVEEIAKGYSLADLVRLEGNQLYKEIKKALRKIENTDSLDSR